MIGRPPRSTLCPYTTLCRSAELRRRDPLLLALHGAVEDPVLELDERPRPLRIVVEHALDQLERHEAVLLRSEEHTSELQSRQYLVCRLLLEKKKSTK